MNYPLKITFRHLPRSSQVVSFVNRRADKLDCFSDRITNCLVVIDAPHQSGKNGNHFRVRMILSMSDYKIIIGNDPEKNHLYKSLSYAVTDTFEIAYNLVWAYLHNP
jgi:hypothetical protein